MKLVVINSELNKYNSNFDNILNRFVQFIDISQSSTRTYIYGIKTFLRYLSNTGINTPTRETVLTYKKYLSQSKSASTISLYLSSLRRFFAWCASEGLYSDITVGVKSPRLDKGHKKDAFSAEQLKGVLNSIQRNALKGKRDYAILALMSATGLRTCEVIRADINDIRTVSGETCLYIQGKGRNSKTEFVKLSKPVIQAIHEYLKARGHVENTASLFASVSHRNAGGRLTTRSISRICKQAMKNAGHDSKRLTAHSLRHSAVTIALMAGLSIQEVSQFARHSSINITMIYAHDIERLKSKCENTISNAIFN